MLGLSLSSVGMGLSSGGAVAFTPLSLVGAEMAAWYDPSDLTSMWQDSAGTTPAAVNSPVGKMNDKSGKGNHQLQATAGFRPILRQSGALYYLEFDGTDDWMRATFAIPQPVDRVSGLRQVTWTAGDQIYGGGTANGSLLYQNNLTPQIHLFSGSAGAQNTDLALNTSAVVTERHDGASSRIAVNNGTYTTGNPGTTAAGGLTLGASFGSGSNSNIWSFGLFEIARALTATEITSLRAYYAAKAGVTL